MTLTPSDMLAIQSAIDAYESRFPHRPSPSAEEALAWRAGSPSDRLMLWWKVVVAPRIGLTSSPKQAEVKESITQGSITRGSITRGSITRGSITRGSWIRGLLPAPHANRNSSLAEAAEGKSLPPDAARGKGSIVLSSGLGAATRGSH